MGLGDWLVRESTIARAVAQRWGRSEKQTGLIAGYDVALLNTMLVHGPGATELLGARHGSDGNSAVFACLAAIAAAYVEPPLRVYRQTAPGEREEQDGPLQTLLDAPNPSMSPLEVWAWVQWAKHLDGNAYLRKMRSGNSKTGNVVQLWPISPTRIEIISQGRDFITLYRYHFAPGKYQDIPVADMLHFRLGLDDQDQRRGLAPLKRLIREVATDQRAAEWTDTLLGNYALPGLIITSDQELTAVQAQEAKDRARGLFAGSSKGEVGVFGKGMRAQTLGFSPEQMNLDSLHHFPEARIAAVLRVPAIVAGLQVGLDASTYSNYASAREAFFESTMVGLWAQDESKIQTQLLPDFTSDPEILVAHDLSDIKAFQTDVDTQYTRLHVAVGGPWMTPNEARAETGLPPLPKGDVLFVPNLVVATPLDKVGAPPPAPPAPPTPLHLVPPPAVAGAPGAATPSAPPAARGAAGAPAPEVKTATRVRIQRMLAQHYHDDGRWKDAQVEAQRMLWEEGVYHDDPTVPTWYGLHLLRELGLMPETKADDAPVAITVADIARAKRWVAGLDGAAALQAAVNGKGKNGTS